MGVEGAGRVCVWMCLKGVDGVWVSGLGGCMCERAGIVCGRQG